MFRLLTLILQEEKLSEEHNKIKNQGEPLREARLY